MVGDSDGLDGCFPPLSSKGEGGAGEVEGGDIMREERIDPEPPAAAAAAAAGLPPLLLLLLP